MKLSLEIYMFQKCTYERKNLTKCIRNVRLKNELMPRPIFATNEFLDQVKLMNLIQVINDSQ